MKTKIAAVASLILMLAACKKEVVTTQSLNATSIQNATEAVNDTVYITNFFYGRDTSAARYNGFSRMATYQISLPSKDSIGSVLTYTRWVLHKTSGVNWNIARQFVDTIRQRKPSLGDKNNFRISFTDRCPLLASVPAQGVGVHSLRIDIEASAVPNNYMWVTLDSVQIKRNGIILPVKIFSRYNVVRKFY